MLSSNFVNVGQGKRQLFLENLRRLKLKSAGDRPGSQTHMASKYRNSGETFPESDNLSRPPHAKGIHVRRRERAQSVCGSLSDE